MVQAYVGGTIPLEATILRLKNEEAWSYYSRIKALSSLYSKQQKSRNLFLCKFFHLWDKIIVDKILLRLEVCVTSETT